MIIFRFLCFLAFLTTAVIPQASAQEPVTTVITIEGLDFGITDYMPKALHGFATAPGHVRKRLKYPAAMSVQSILKGAWALDEMIRSTPGPKIVLAHSQGAQVVGQWMREHAYAEDAPSPDELSFILIGNPERLYGRRPNSKGFDGKLLLPTPNDTQYRVFDISRRYDGWANADNWPDTDTPNTARLRMGRMFDHPHYENVDIDDPSNMVRATVGNTAYIVTTK